MDPKVVKAAIEAAVASFCATLPQVPGPVPVDYFSDTTPQKYNVKEAFGGEPSWVKDVRSDRFEGTLKDGILYRPIIAKDIYEQILLCLSSRFRKGLMIKGPQGIGKSHSLVNVVHKLQYSGSYFVTFFPDCEKWEGTQDFLDTVCASFGTTLEDLGIDRRSQFNNIFVDAFIEVIDAALAKQGKQWVFVFDQIDRLFVRPENRQSKDAGVLAFPFSLIATVRKKNRITSIISASANNELAYKDKHEGFIEYEHPTQMTGEELGIAFGIRDDTMKDLLGVSGGVPLYASLYTSNPKLFQSDVDADVYRSIEGLRKDREEWEEVSESIYSALLETSTSASRYDKKFLLQEPVQKGGTPLWNYKPLLPAVASSYRRYLWEGLVEYVEKKED